MSFSFQCPACNASVSASARVAGRRVRCPECDTTVTVPAMEEPAALEPVPAASADDERGTVGLQPLDVEGEDTVMLEAIDVVPESPPALIVEPSSGLEPLGELEPLSSGGDEPPYEEEEEPASGGFEKREIEETEMDMTPMVDVTFLLLIFFMVTAAFTLQKSLQVPNPESDEASETAVPEDQSDDTVTCEVTEFDTYRVVWVSDDVEAPTEVEMLRALRDAQADDTSGKQPTTLLVEAHVDSKHRTVVAALSAGSEAGFTNVMLKTTEGE